MFEKYMGDMEKHGANIHYTIYDNDDTGKKMSRKIYESYAIPFIDISEFTDHKDLADYFMEGGGYLPIHERIFKIKFRTVYGNRMIYPVNSIAQSITARTSIKHDGIHTM